VYISTKTYKDDIKVIKSVCSRTKRISGYDLGEFKMILF
jgi:hypothetical protein